MAASLSIVCITHRKGALLQRTLRETLPLLSDGDEFLVVDDGGFDRQIVSEFQHPGLRHLVVPHYPYNLCTTSNIGTLLAKNEFVVKIDGDVLLQPEALAGYREQLQDHHLVGGRIDFERQHVGLVKDHRFNHHTGDGDDQPLYYWGGNLGYRRSTFLELGGFLRDFVGVWGCEDADLAFRFAAKEYSSKLCFDLRAIHQWHPVCAFRHGYERNKSRLQENISAYARGNFPRPLQFPLLNIAVSHIGLRPYRSTVLRALEGLQQVSIPHRFWVVLQDAHPNCTLAVGALLSGHEFEILESERNRGLAWPKKQVHDRVGAGEFLLNLDDDMVISDQAVEQMYATLLTSSNIGVAAFYTPGLVMCSLKVLEDRTLQREVLDLEEPFTFVDHTSYGCAMWSDKALRSCPPDDRFFVGGVDLDLSMKLHKAGLQVAVCTSPHQVLRHHVRAPRYTAVRYDPVEIERARRLVEDSWNIKIQAL
jgi:glycosyltransferase involved in cell wall biosynthesis